jgi:hypothetical protein
MYKIFINYKYAGDTFCPEILVSTCTSLLTHVIVYVHPCMLVGGGGFNACMFVYSSMHVGPEEERDIA